MQQRTVQVLRFSLFFGLAFWGGYSLLRYLGVPVHGTVLFSDATKNILQERCGDADVFCRAWGGIWSTVLHTFGRAAPFLGYTIIWGLFYAVLFVRSALRAGEWKLQMVLRPWHYLVLFVASTWLMFTVLSLGTVDGIPARRLFEAVQHVYVKASPDALVALDKNIKELSKQGCLSPRGATPHGADIYDMSMLCIQESFVTRVMSQMVFLGGLLLTLLILGSTFLRFFRMKFSSILLESTVALGLGSCLLMAFLWFFSLLSLGAVKLLHWGALYTALSGWLILLAIPILCYRELLRWWKIFCSGGSLIILHPRNTTPILGWLLLSYLALNFLSVVRPFPIGWDDLGVYLNQPRLLVSYGYFIPKLGAYKWEYLTSLGFLLFGYDSIFGATGAMLINWSAGLLATLSVLAFGRAFLGKGAGILAALVYYTLPLVGHFSYADMKVDNAVFAMGTLSTLILFLVLFPVQEPDEPEEQPSSQTTDVHLSFHSWPPVLLSAIFAGFAFALKPTAVMVVMALLATLLGAAIHWTGFLAGVSLVCLLFTLEGRLNIVEIASRVYGNPDAIGKTSVVLLFLIVSIAAGGIACFLHPRRAVIGAFLSTVFLGGFLATIVPWTFVNNGIGVGFRLSEIPISLRLEAPNTLTPGFVIDGSPAPENLPNTRALPKELGINPNDPACKSTGKNEELDRYWGNHAGWGHYVSLPWRTVMNLDSAGYYVTTVPALLLLPLLLFLTYFWSPRGRWSRYLFWGTLFLVVQWSFLANGIPWYGIGMFLGLAVSLEVLVYKAPDKPTKALAGFFVAFSLIIAFAMRFWQFEQQRNLYEYAFGKISAEAMRERTIPRYDDVRGIITERFSSVPNRPYVYRVGTFIPYFIPRNLEVLPVADNQLDFFSCLHQEGDPALTLKRLQALGFNSVIFDTNTATIERDPNGTLHRKVQAFVDFLNTSSLGLRIVFNDPDDGIAFILLP